MTSHVNFPGGSKSRVSRAGDNIRNHVPTPEDLKVIEEWRAAHRGVLNTFQAILRTRTKGTNVTVAQRHKRKNTIFDKLQRLPSMQLARMDDVAGCRLIFKDIKGLNKFRGTFHEARFNHKRRNEPNKYNYIINPKSTGYRGIHDVYEYDVNSESGKVLAGFTLKYSIEHLFNTHGLLPLRLLDSSQRINQNSSKEIKDTSTKWPWLARSLLGRMRD